MCGIVAAISYRDIVPNLLTGLRHLEYRGYDSAGLAVLDRDQKIQRHREIGKVHELEKRLSAEPIDGHIGIAHTRWATHGVPERRNAHPQVAGDRIAIVHNGIIENEASLRSELQKKGYVFESETDTELVAFCILEHLKTEDNILKAFQKTLLQLEGSYALCVMDAKTPGKIYAARSGGPIVIGLGQNENFIASDILALQFVTQNFIYLEDGDLVELSQNSYQIFAGQPYQIVTRSVKERKIDFHASGKGQYRHFMLKEIFEQPISIQETLEGRYSAREIHSSSFGPNAARIFERAQAIQIVACGTSFHAGLIAKFWFESLSQVPCAVEIASEFRFRPRVTMPDTLLICLSQSGETADTLAALKDTLDDPNILSRLCICNVPESSLVRASELVFLTAAGPEIGVCSTKAFTTQLTALLMLACVLSHTRQTQLELRHAVLQNLMHLPALCEQTLKLAPEIKAMAQYLSDKHHALFIGRGLHFPVALEGALKLKEISYIHAEAYPAGELKHGPLALIDKGMAVVVIAPKNAILDKIRANMQEILARGGHLLVFSEADTGFEAGPQLELIEVPKSLELMAPLIYSIPLQLLAYEVAVLRGTDVDQPRNLAKSVTVE